MKDIEIQNYNKLIELISPYSEDLDDSKKESILIQVNEIAAFEVEIYDLDTYWKSRSVEEFCKELATERVSVGILSEEEILKAIKLIYEAEEDIEEFDYYLSKFSDAIEYHFQKSTGALIEALDSDENDSFDKVVSILRNRDTICL